MLNSVLARARLSFHQFPLGFHVLSKPNVLPCRRPFSSTQSPSELHKTTRTSRKVGRTILLGSVIVAGALLAQHRTAEPGSPSWLLRVYAQLPLRFVSRVWGMLAEKEIPLSWRESILGLYARTFGCKMHEAVEPDLKAYSSLANLFYRSLKDGVRPISGAPLVSPADGRVLSISMADDEGVLEQVKGIPYHLQTLLDGSTPSQHPPRRARPGTKIYSIIIYLAPGDYHRYHSPTTWEITHAKHFAGKLLSVSPAIAKLFPGLFAINERVSLVGTWRGNLMFSFVAVGATNVGSIVINKYPSLLTNQPHLEDLPLSPEGAWHAAKGEEIGGFRLGSTLVLAFEAPDPESSSEEWVWSVSEGDRLVVGEPLGYFRYKL